MQIWMPNIKIITQVTQVPEWHDNASKLRGTLRLYNSNRTLFVFTCRASIIKQVKIQPDYFMLILSIKYY